MKKSLYSAFIAAIAIVSLSSIPALAQEKVAETEVAPVAQTQVKDCSSCPKAMQNDNKPCKMKCGKKGPRHGATKHHMNKHPHRHNPERELQRLTKELNLNDEQQEKIGKILDDYAADCKTSMEAERQKRQQELKQLREKLSAERKSVDNQIESLLNADQKAKFAEIQKNRQNKIGQPARSVKLDKHHGHHHHAPSKDGHVCKPHEPGHDCNNHKDGHVCGHHEADHQNAAQDGHVCKPHEPGHDCNNHKDGHVCGHEHKANHDCKPCDKTTDCTPCKQQNAK